MTIKTTREDDPKDFNLLYICLQKDFFTARESVAVGSLYIFGGFRSYNTQQTW